MSTDIYISKNNPQSRLFRHDFGVFTAWADNDKFYAELKRTFFSETGLIPPGLKWISPAKSFWLFECAPHLATIQFHFGEVENIQKDQTYIFHVWLPWTALLIEINVQCYPIRTWVYGLYGPIKSDNDKLGVLPLPNHYPSAQVCYPDSIAARASSINNIAEAVILAKEIAWSSFANEDVMKNYDNIMGMKMPSWLFTDNNGNYRSCEDWTDILAAWEKTSAFRIIEHKDPYIIPSNSILYPENLLGGDPLPTIGSMKASISTVEHYNFDTEKYTEEAIYQAHARSL